MATSLPDDAYLDKTDIALSSEFGRKWNNAISNLAKVLDVPVAIIFKKDSDRIEVMATNHDEKNPFKVGDSIPIKGSFCNYVFEKDDEFYVPDYRDIDLDINNVATQQDFVSYLGFPLKWPNGELFGTICILDDTRNTYSQSTNEFLSNFRDLLADSLALIELNYSLQRDREFLKQKVEEQSHYEGTVPLCPHCNKVHLQNAWVDLKDLLLHDNEGQLFKDVINTCDSHHHHN